VAVSRRKTTGVRFRRRQSVANKAQSNIRESSPNFDSVEISRKLTKEDPADGQNKKLIDQKDSDR